jgi:hypothetical protein
VNGSAQTPPKTLGEWDDNSKWEDKQWRGCEESSTVASSSPAPSPAPTGTLSSAAANVNQGALQFLNRALNAAPPPAPLPPPPAPKVWCSYVWDKEMVAQFTATSKADLETLCTPHTIEFQGMEVQLHVADDKATMNAFFTPNPSPSQAECEALAKLLEVRLTKWAPPVPKPTGPPPEPPEAGDQLWRCANAYECQHASQLKCSIGQLVKECGPQANGWLHVKTASGTEGYVASTSFVKEGRTAQAYSAVAAPAPGYLPLSRGDRLVVTYVDGAWLYGYRGQETAETREEQKGWFPRYCTIYGLHH